MGSALGCSVQHGRCDLRLAHLLHARAQDLEDLVGDLDAIFLGAGEDARPRPPVPKRRRVLLNAPLPDEGTQGPQHLLGILLIQQLRGLVRADQFRVGHQGPRQAQQVSCGRRQDHAPIQTFLVGDHVNNVLLHTKLSENRLDPPDVAIFIARHDPVRQVLQQGAFEEQRLCRHMQYTQVGRHVEDAHRLSTLAVTSHRQLGAAEQHEEDRLAPSCRPDERHQLALRDGDAGQAEP
mmetsp:Transcript_63179/g.206166  ORF Transcript_63179/g.206166 Transcript_63179/m.206166 type:complete len:236 (+) Transcript_63179:58-765(+)